MTQYINQFKSIIGKVQTEQVLKLLNNKRNTGQIRSVQEFSKELENLIRELTSSGLTPSLKLYNAVEDEKIDSDTYNFMLDRVQDDLEASFQEVNQIDQVQQSHEALIKDVILKNLKAGISELDNKISVYEFIASNKFGFDKALFSSFKESSNNRTTRGVEKTAIVFEDPRIKDLIASNEDAYVEISGDKLTLPIKNIDYFNIKSMRQIFDIRNPQSELIVEPPRTTISNIIDGKKGTYWIQSLIFEDKKESIRTKFEINLGAIKEINFIEIELASQQDIVLESIYYLDSNNTFVDLSINEVGISYTSIVKFNKITTNKLIATFRNENFYKVDFEYNEEVTPLLDQALNKTPGIIKPSIKNIQQDLDTILSSSAIKDLIGIAIEETKSSFNGYAYTIGFDNIKVGFATYKTRGIYVSNAFSGTSIGQLGLKTTENRPYKSANGVYGYTDITYDLDTKEDLYGDVFFSDPDNVNLLSSIEYWVIKQDFDSKDLLVNTSIFPILPIDTTRIFHERLVLSDKSNSSRTTNNVGYTIFFTNSTSGNIKVYRNGIEITEGTDWSIDTSPQYSTPNSGTRMTARIIVNTIYPGDIYTISYDPLESTTNAVFPNLVEFSASNGLRIVDMTGDLSARLVANKKILLDSFDENLEGSTKVFLSIIIRRNSSDSSLSPAIEEYTLMAGSNDKSKFEV